MKKAKSVIGAIIVLIAIIVLVPMLAEAEIPLRIHLVADETGEQTVTAVKIFENGTQTGYIQNFKRGTSFDFVREVSGSTVTLQIHQASFPWCNEEGNPTADGTPIASAATMVEVTIAVPTDAANCILVLPELPPPPPPVCPDPNNPECPVCPVPNVPNYPGYVEECAVVCPEENVPNGDQGYFPDSPNCPIDCPTDNTPGKPDHNPDCPYCPDENNPSCPIAITTCEDFQKINANPAGEYYLVDNINCGGSAPKTPLSVFTGTLNGNNKTVSNLYINVMDTKEAGQVMTVTDGGLFEGINDATIKDINFNGAQILTEYNANRGLIAPDATGSTLSNITIQNLLVTGRDHNKHEVPGVPTASTGGVLGITDQGTVLSNVKVLSGAVSRNAFGGGLIGKAGFATEIKLSNFKGTVDQPQCFETSAYSYQEKPCAAGGLIGYVVAMGTTISTPVIIDQSFSSNRVDARFNAGGLIGMVDSSIGVNISNSYSTAKIVRPENDESRYAGGLIGKATESSGSSNQDINLNTTYAAGYVEVKNKNGGKGVLGTIEQHVSPRGQGSSNYFDKDQTTQANSGVGSVAAGKSTTDMKKTTTYSGWSTAIWKFNDGKDYPRLVNNP
jgi:hypothetical protein